MNTFTEITIKSRGPIYTLTINKPEKKNILSPLCLKEIEAAIGKLSTKQDLRVLVITGQGNEAFCAGYDLEALPCSEDKLAWEALDRIPPLEAALSAIESFPYPVLAMMNGYAYGGGCELALSCDIRVAAQRVTMAMTALKLGLVYPQKGLERFIRKIGLASTIEMFFSARPYISEQCLRLGLVNVVVEDDQLERYTYELASEIALRPPLALRGTKKAIYTLASSPPIDDKAIAELKYLFKRSLLSQDHLERRKAFLQGRSREERG